MRLTDGISLNPSELTKKLLFLRLSLILTLLFVTAVADCVALQAVRADSSATDTTSQKFGFIQFRVEPDTAYLYVDQNYDSPVVLSGEKKMKFSARSHQFLIFGEQIPDRRFYIDVKAGETFVYNIQIPKRTGPRENHSAFAAYKSNANLVVFTDKQTTIQLFNTSMEAQGVLRAKLPAGVHRVQFVRQDGGVKDRFIEVNDYQLTTLELYLKPQKDTSVIRGLIPGAAQLYKKETGKAVLAFGAVGLTTAAALYYNSRISDEGQAFNRALSEYNSTRNEVRALELGDRLDRLDSELQTLNRNRNIFRAAAALFYVANIVDAFRAPDSGFARSRPFDPYRDFAVELGPSQLKAKVEVRF